MLSIKETKVRLDGNVGYCLAMACEESVSWRGVPDETRHVTTYCV